MPAAYSEAQKIKIIVQRRKKRSTGAHPRILWFTKGEKQARKDMILSVIGILQYCLST